MYYYHFVSMFELQSSYREKLNYLVYQICTPKTTTGTRLLLVPFNIENQPL